MNRGSEMVLGERGKTGCRSWLLFCLLASVMHVGCAGQRGNVEKKLMTEPSPAEHARSVAESYRVGCPDVLEVRIAQRPGLAVRTIVGPDGCVRLPADLGDLRVEGRTIAESAGDVASRAQTAALAVSVRVIEYNSQQVYLFGQVKGSHRSVPYCGPETVLDLLQRAGGITAGAEPGDVYVIRSHIAEEGRPEVYHVDLRAIVIKGDQTTNVRLMPYDQVHVGETRQARVERCIPPWLRPIYQTVWDTRPEGSRPEAVRQLSAWPP